MTTYDYNTGKPLAEGQQQSSFNAQTGERIGGGTSSTSTTTPQAAPSHYTPTNNATPTFGESSPSTLALQQSLNAKGAGIKEDSKYGPETQAAYDKYFGQQNTQTPEEKITEPAATEAPTEDANTLALKKAEDDFQTEAKNVHDTILNIQNGSIPLSTGENAQIQGLQQQFQGLIQQQELQNKGAAGIANVRGYQTGAAEYDPSFQVKTIGSIITAGQTKIADLNVKMASAVAELTQSFKDNDIKAIKDAYSVYQDASKKRTDAIQKTIDDAQKKLKEFNDAKQKTQDDVNKIAEDAAKNGADVATIKAITSAGSVGDALNAAGDYAQGGTGIVGEYQFYKRNALSNGLKPVDFNTYQNMDANRKKSIAKAGVAPTTTVDEDGNVITSGNYDALTIGRYNKAANAATSILQKNPTFKNIIGSSAYLDRIEAAVKNPGSVGDQELLDAFTQLNTGGNRVTEAQVHLITANQSLSDLINKAGNKLKSGGALSDAQRKEIVDLSHEVYKNYQKSYKPLYQDATKRLKAQGIPEEFWNIPNPDTLSRAVSETSSEDPRSTVDSYIASNPNEVDTVSKLYDLPGWTDQDVLDYLKLNKKI